MVFNARKVFHGYKQSKVGQIGIGFDFSLVSSLEISYLSQLEKLIIRRDRPKDVCLSGGCFLQFVEAHLDLPFSLHSCAAQ